MRLTLLRDNMTITETRILEIEDGDDLREIEVEIEWKYIIEKDYGADADGNRGIDRAYWEAVSWFPMTDETTRFVEGLDGPMSR